MNIAFKPILIAVQGEKITNQKHSQKIFALQLNQI